MNPLPPLTVMLLLPIAVAQDVPQPTLPTQATFRSVYVGAGQADGSIWVRGERYKVGLDAAGAHFQPLLGPKAPRDYPLHLRLAALSADGKDLPIERLLPAQTGERRVEVPCGAAIERWDFTPQHAEQSFVFAKRPAAGELLIDLAVESAMALTAQSATELTFSAPGGLGGVHCRDAVAIDATGQRLTLPFGFAAGHLQLRVPAEFVAAATFPLTVDPVLSTFAIDTTISDMRNPRLEYEPTNDVWLVVQEEQLSATDSDIQCLRFAGNTSAPTLLDTVYAANTPAITRNPDVGLLGSTQRFQIAWCITTGVGTNGAFEYRQRNANDQTQGATFGFGAGFGSDPGTYPRIGGCLAGNRWLLVGFKQFATAGQVAVAILGTDSNNYGNAVLYSGLGTVSGDVSTLRDANDHWGVVWANCPTPTTAPCPGLPIQMAAVGGTAPIVTQPAISLGMGTFVAKPTIAGWGGQLLAAWDLPVGIFSRIGCQAIGPVAGVYQPLGAAVDLSQLVGNVPTSHDQSAPSLSFDGARFVCAYLDDDDIAVHPFASTLLVDANGITAHESHRALPHTATQVTSALASASTPTQANATRGHHGIVWAQPGATNSDTAGAFVDARTNGGTTSVAQTGCGAPAEPTLTLVGTPALGRTNTFVLGNITGLPFVLLGASQISPLPGCGTCQSGVQLPVPFSFLTSSLSITWPVDLSFHASQWSVQGLDLLQLGGCPSNVFGAAFTVTDTITVRIL